jgi:Icc-related predicted phosphoesterase
MLHGTSTTIDGVSFFGLGGGVPPTPFEWSFDLTEQQAGDLLTACPTGAVLCVHSPPYGYLDLAGGRHLGSGAILEAIRKSRPQAFVCGHIHECWGRQAVVEAIPLLNLGPHGAVIEV